MAPQPGASPPPPPHATQGPSGVGDKNTNTHAQSMLVDMCVAALAPLPHVCSNQQGIRPVGANKTSSEFVEAVPQLLQKRNVRVARHLQVWHIKCNIEHGMHKSAPSGMESMVCLQRQCHSRWSKTGCGPLHWL